MTTIQTHYNGQPLAVFNPCGKAVETLPVIYGFNNGGSPGWYSGCLLAEDGEGLGGHLCSHEGFMPGDLGCLEGSRADRHEGCKEHYPEGYRMEFVPERDAMSHAGLEAAYQRNQAKSVEDQERNASVAEPLQSIVNAISQPAQAQAPAR